MNERIGVLGGAFDPIHFGHLILAQAALDELRLTRVIFVPTFAPTPQHKIIPTSFEHRVAMLRLATADNPSFRVSEIEESIKPPTYTVTMLEHLQRELGAAKLFFLMGADSLAQLSSWHQPQRLLELAELAVAPRTGSDLASTYPFRRLSMPMVDVSATDLRRRIRDHFSLRYLVPEPVVAYIDANRLYREV